MMKTEEDKKESFSDPIIDKPCIYGKEVREICTVRTAFQAADPLSRYRLPKSKMLEEVKEAIDLGMEALDRDPQQLRILVDFCHDCPYLETFYWIRIFDLQKGGLVSKK